jgi:hypothetical protein
MNNKLVTSLVVLTALALGFSVFNYLRPATILVQTPDGKTVTVGSAAGNTFEQKVNFYKGFVNGGSTLDASTTLTIARTITAAELCNNGTITVNSEAVAGTQSAASLDLTLAATSTLFSECLKNEGDEIMIDILNQSPTAATTTEIVQGGGCTQVIGVSDGDDTIPGQKGATVTIKRIHDWLADGGSSDCVVRIYEWN